MSDWLSLGTRGPTRPARLLGARSKGREPPGKRHQLGGTEPLASLAGFRHPRYLSHKGELRCPLIRWKVGQTTEAKGRLAKGVRGDPHPRPVARRVTILDQSYIAPGAGHVKPRLPWRREDSNQIAEVINGPGTLRLAMPLHVTHATMW